MFAVSVVPESSHDKGNFQCVLLVSRTPCRVFPLDGSYEHISSTGTLALAIVYV